MSAYVIGVTGASGVVYAERLIRFIVESGMEAHIVLSQSGSKVIGNELKGDTLLLGENDLIKRYDYRDMAAPIASGSFKTKGMVVIPCSMKTLASIAHGISSNLVERAADVTIKEGRPLVVVPREMPLSPIHLRNMLTLAEMGVRVAAAMPAFYHRPESIADMIDFVVGKTLDQLGVDHQIYKRWKGEN